MPTNIELCLLLMQITLYTCRYDRRMIILICANIAELMERVKPEMYHPYITYSNIGVSILCVLLTKTLYGILRPALLIYKRLIGNLLRLRRYGVYT